MSRSPKKPWSEMTLEETKAWQEDCLKADYGGHWIHMIRTQSGAGYEICEELLDKIEEMEMEEE